jgi:hypothetical protein
MGGACSTNGIHEKCIQILVTKSEQRRPLKRPGHRQEDDVKMYLKDTEFEDMDWINLAQDMDYCGSHVNTVMRLRFPYMMGNLLSS